MSGSKRKYNKTEKDLQLIVLQEMLEEKEQLFGKFNGVRQTKKDVSDAWSRVSLSAARYGLVGDTDGDKFRRVTWQNWRRSTMIKIDRIKQTGVGGAGKEDLLDENDKMILAIVGPSVSVGLGAHESNGDVNPTRDEVREETSFFQEESKPSSSQQAHKPKKKKKSDDALKRELLKVALYKNRLECRALEISLDMCYSKYTKTLTESSSSSED